MKLCHMANNVEIKILLIVEKYSPTIFNVKGVHNIITGMLSRVPHQDLPLPEIIETCFLLETEHFPLTFSIIAQAQAEQSHLPQILQQYPLEDKKRFLQGQLIIYFNDNIPLELQLRLIQWYHEQLLHPEISRLIESMQQHFLWKDMSKDISPTFPKHARNVKYSNDHENNMGNFHQKYITYILGMKCVWTLLVLGLFKQQIRKHPSVYWPQQLLNYRHHGLWSLQFQKIKVKLWLLNLNNIGCTNTLCPLQYIHDNGSEFAGVDFQEMIASYGITAIITTDAIIERIHQVIANMLCTSNPLADPETTQLNKNFMQHNGQSTKPTIQLSKPR